ncbi:MAG TPA: CAP domain-containing protein [Actinomycetota bacterium]|jgi:hypothetical protein
MSGVAFAQADIERCFVDRTNAERVQRGLGAMAVNPDLVVMARRQSQRMADAGTIFHNPNLAAEGPKGWKLLGENVGVGPSCESLHQAFMNSEHHRDNILEPRFNNVGMGVVLSGSSTIYITEQFMQTAVAPGSVSSPPPHEPSPSPKPAVAPSPKPITPRPSPPRPPQPSRSPSPRPSPQAPPQPSPQAPPVASPSPSASPPAPPSPSPPGSPSVRAESSAARPGPSPLALVGLGLLVVAAVAGLSWALRHRRRS